MGAHYNLRSIHIQYICASLLHTACSHMNTHGATTCNGDIEMADRSARGGFPVSGDVTTRQGTNEGEFANHIRSQPKVCGY